jgi:hypothetical protein
MDYCKQCETSDPVLCVHLKVVAGSEANPADAAPGSDTSMIWTVTTFTNKPSVIWFPTAVIIKPTSYNGTSFQGYSPLCIMAGRQPAVGAGADTPYEIVPAGKAIKIPPGWYTIFSYVTGSNINARIYPAEVDKRKWLSKAYFGLPPTFATVGVASALALAARVGRSFLYLKNTSATETISLSFGANASNPAVLYSGFTLAPGEWRTWFGDDCPEDAVNAIASAAATNMAMQEA